MTTGSVPPSRDRHSSRSSGAPNATITTSTSSDINERLPPPSPPWRPASKAIAPTAPTGTSYGQSAGEPVPSPHASLLVGVGLIRVGSGAPHPVDNDAEDLAMGGLEAMNGSFQIVALGPSFGRHHHCAMGRTPEDGGVGHGQHRGRVQKHYVGQQRELVEDRLQPWAAEQFAGVLELGAGRKNLEPEDTRVDQEGAHRGAVRIPSAEPGGRAGTGGGPALTRHAWRLLGVAGRKPSLTVFRALPVGLD